MKINHMKNTTVLKRVALHEAWLRNDPAGKQMNIRNATISDIDLSRKDLRYARFTNVTFERVNLMYTNLEDAQLQHVTFNSVGLEWTRFFSACIRSTRILNSFAQHANFEQAQLDYCEIENTKFYCADLSHCRLAHATITNCPIEEANLYSINLSFSTLNNVSLKKSNLYAAHFGFSSLDTVEGLPRMICPEKGGFTAFKAVSVSGRQKAAYSSFAKCDAIAELYIPETAKRSSGTTRQCRCSRAKVIGFYSPSGRKLKATKAVSGYHPDFVYTKGKYVKSEFDKNRWETCTEGIHFVMTFDEAKEYLPAANRK